MHPPLRIAVLETGDTLPNCRKKYGGYGDVCERLLKAGARESGRIDPEKGLKVTSYDVVGKLDNYPSLKDYDAIMITGSKYDAFADTPWILKLVDFTRQVLAQNRVRILGVCFGHQIIGRALGAEVGRNDKGWEAAVSEFPLSTDGQRLFKKDTLMHLDIVAQCPKGIQNLGSSPVCAVQGMYAPRRLLTLQGHPEFDEEIMREILEVYQSKEAFGETLYNKYYPNVALKHDGVLVGSAFLQFLLDE